MITTSPSVFVNTEQSGVGGGEKEKEEEEKGGWLDVVHHSVGRPIPTDSDFNTAIIDYFD
jgi:hypothetical protein